MGIEGLSHHLVILVSGIQASFEPLVITSSFRNHRQRARTQLANISADFCGGYHTFPLINHILIFFAGFVHQTASHRTRCHHTTIRGNDPRCERAQWKGM